MPGRIASGRMAPGRKAHGAAPDLGGGARDARREARERCAQPFARASTLTLREGRW
jgi:hypothetical protein